MRKEDDFDVGEQKPLGQPSYFRTCFFVQLFLHVDQYTVHDTLQTLKWVVCNATGV